MNDNNLPVRLHATTGQEVSSRLEPTFPSDSITNAVLVDDVTHLLILRRIHAAVVGERKVERRLKGSWKSV